MDGRRSRAQPAQAADPLTALDNRLRVLHALRREPGISKTRLTGVLGLGSGTVSVLVGELADQGLAVSRGYSPSTGGRPAERLALNPDRPLMLGVDLGETDARFGVLNLQGELVLTDRQPLRRKHGVVDLQPLLDRIGKLVAGAPRIAGAGVAVPGRIERTTGRVIRASNLGWRDLPLRGLLEDAVPLPFVVDRNTDAALLGEEWWGSLPAGDPVVFVTVGSGVGAALRVHGRFVYGTSDAAGEFGHIPVAPDGPLCRCGSRGCLETLTSVRALLARYRELRRAAGDPVRGGRPSVASIAAASADDPCAMQALTEVADRLGNGLVTLASILNPSAIVLGGELMDAEDVVLPRIMTTLERRGPEAPGAGVRVMRSTFRDRASLVGAATLGFEALFADVGRS